MIDDSNCIFIKSGNSSNIFVKILIFSSLGLLGLLTIINNDSGIYVNSCANEVLSFN